MINTLLRRACGLRGSILLAALAVSVLGSAPASAQEVYPARPIHMVIPYTTGATDTLGRLVAQGLAERLGQQIVVENRPGAGSVTATAQVAKSNPDGYLLLFGTLAQAINATMVKKLPYQPLDDFQFIGKVGQLTFAVVVRPDFEARDLPAALSLMRANPGKYDYASAGVGTPMHLGFELLKQLTGTQAVHVPYKGEVAGLTDVLTGRVGFILCSIPTCAQRVKDGQVKALAVSSAQRSALLPNVPSSTEAGVPGFETYSWFTISAPRGMPRAAVDRVSAALNDLLKDPQFKARAIAMGVETDASSTPEGTTAFVRSEIEKWRPIVVQTGATAE